MTETGVVAQVHPVIAGLEKICSHLLFLEASLPEGASEASEDLEELDYATALRSVLRCVVEDSVRPAIEGLRSVCALAPSPAQD